MNVYLVRHAEAKSEYEDPERSLTDTGWKNIRKIAAFIGGSTHIRVDSVFHSGKTRARQTAEALADTISPAHGIRETGGLKPMDDPSIWADRLQEETGNVMLVGHLPHLGRLASLLLCRDENSKVADFPDAGVLCLEKDAQSPWSVRWMIIPEILP